MTFNTFEELKNIENNLKVYCQKWKIIDFVILRIRRQNKVWIFPRFVLCCQTQAKQADDSWLSFSCLISAEKQW